MLTITLLGTAATMPLPDRALSTAFAACGGHGLLFDCGEGTQAAARRAGVNLMRADAVCLTHYHGDHIFGLPGLLQTLGAQAAPGRCCWWGRKGLPASGAPCVPSPGRCPMPCVCRKQTGRWHWMRCRRAGRRVLCCVPLPPGTGCPAWVIGWSCPGQAGSTRPGPGRWGYRCSNGNFCSRGRAFS